MKTLRFTKLALALLLFSFLAQSSFGQSSKDQELLMKTIIKIREQWKTLTPEVSTRSDLLKIFKEEGGLFIPQRRIFAYQGCSMIKVDVEFAIPTSTKEENPSDMISKISKPYLDSPIWD
jgi:hypothetical protein